MDRACSSLCSFVVFFFLAGVLAAAAPEPRSIEDLSFARSENFVGQTAEFHVDGHKAFLVKPPHPRTDGRKPWIWYAPTLANGDGTWELPGPRHVQAIQSLLDAGCYFGGVDVGESCGSPAGRETFTVFHGPLVDKLGLEEKAMLFPVSRGGLMHFNWAAEHPEGVRCIGAIYPVCSLASYPRLERAAKAYGMSVEDLQKELGRHNPVDRLAPLAANGVPLFHLHGDQDTVVPLAENSGLVASRYRELGGSIELVVVPGKGHEIAPEFWENPRLAEFFRKCLEKP